MPPQMGSIAGACDVMPLAQARTTRQAMVATNVGYNAKHAVAKSAAAAVKEADEKTRPSLPQEASAAAAPAAGRHNLRASSPPAPGRPARENRGGGDDDPRIQARLEAMHERFGGELAFLVTEFTKLEAQLSLEVGGGTESAPAGDEASPQQQLSRLRFFVEHVKRTTDRIKQAKNGLHSYTLQQVDMLEDHITQRLLPVKERMLAQLALQSSRVASDPAPPPMPYPTSSSSGGKFASEMETCGGGGGGGGLFLGNFSGKDDASAVSNSWAVGTPTSTVTVTPAFSDGGDSGAGPAAAAASLSMPRPCSSLSFVDLGDLCGDQEAADDCCGGVYLVDLGEDCDRVDDSGIGLDLYDLGQGKESFLVHGDHGDQRIGRWPSISTLSATSATTDSEMSDDAFSVDADIVSSGPSSSCSSSPSPMSLWSSTSARPKDVGESLKAKAAHADAIVGAAVGKSEAVAKAAAAIGDAAADAGADASADAATKSGIDQDMGELSELFAPDAFLMSTALDTEMEAASGSSGDTANQAAAPAIDVVIEPTATGAATPATARTAAVVAVAAPTLVKAESPPITAAAPPAGVTKLVASPLAPTPTAAPAGPAPAAPAVSPKPECRCGEAACPSLTPASRKRPTSDISPSSSPLSSSSTAADGIAGSGAPLPMLAGMSFAGLTSRQRKRQRSLAPVLSASRTVTYECTLCKESYPSEVKSNPFWSLFRHECPRCHRMQIPRVDAASAAVSVDYIHAVCAEDGEGCDSDGYGSDSCSDDEDDGPDDAREGIAPFDTDVIAGDTEVGCKAGRLSTLQASRLLVLMSHARTCPGRHAKAQHAEVCRSTKFLMLHMRDCNGYGPTGDPCGHRWCRPCKSLLSHLVRCPSPNTCRICTPLDLPEPLRQLRELNVAQARNAAAAAAAPAAVAHVSATAVAMDVSEAAVVKTDAEKGAFISPAVPVSTTVPVTTPFQHQLVQQREVVG